MFFDYIDLPKIQRGDPCKMSYTNVAESFWNSAQLNKIKKIASSQNLKFLTQKTKKMMQLHMCFPENLEDTPYK